MRGILIVIALAASFAVQAVSASPDCIEGYWDLGKNAAAMGFQCGQEGQWVGPNEGRLFFCQRQALLSEGVCTGRNFSIGCRWDEQGSAWLCHETPTEHSRFDAVIKRISEGQIRYQAISHFNQVDLVGELIH